MGSAGPQFDIFSNYLNTIDGKLVGTDQTRHGVNPATGKPNPEVPVSTSQDVDAAVEAGQRAFKTWSKTSWAERQKAVSAYADAIDKHAGDFAKLLTMEQGKPVSVCSRDRCSKVNHHRFNSLRERLLLAPHGCEPSTSSSSRKRPSKKTIPR